MKPAGIWQYTHGTGQHGGAAFRDVGDEGSLSSGEMPHEGAEEQTA